MLHLEAASVGVTSHVNAISTPGKLSVRRMDDRKRSASEYDDGAILPAAKRQATVLMNGGDDQTAQDSDKIKFGVSNSPWQVDLAVSHRLSCHDHFGS